MVKEGTRILHRARPATVPARLRREAGTSPAPTTFSLPGTHPGSTRHLLPGTSSAPALWFLAAYLLGCTDAPPLPPETEPPAFHFVDVAAEAGLDFVHDNGASGQFYYPELLQGGAALVDVDNDSWLDVYLVQSGPLPPRPGSVLATDLARDRLFRNRGDGTFEDITERSSTGDRGYGSGVASGDVDGDGWVDLYVTNLGRNTLYRNLGAGVFEDVTERAGVGDPGYSTSAAFLDYDEDGDLDLYVCHYVVWSLRVERPCLGPNGQRGYCNPNEYEPEPDTLYRNEGDGTFTDVSRAAGIRDAPPGNGLGVLAADFDGDGRVDIYVANDQEPNFLFENQGDGTFREEALLLGAALSGTGQPEASMGVAIVDWDEDRDWDLFLTHLVGETNTFYRNEAGSFRDTTDELRLGAVSQPYTGFGTGFFDFDHDGLLDLFIANGKVSPGDDVEFEYAEPNLLLRGRDDGTFEDASDRAGPALTLIDTSRAAAFGDVDNDGDVDILVATNDGPVRLLRNDSAMRGHWLIVELEDPYGAALGAVVTAEAGARVRQRLAHPAYSYCASSDPRVHFGLGATTTVDLLRVVWPDGTVTERQGVATDQILRLGKEGDARAPASSSGGR